ncbi:ubiquinol--cytochrome-c reductase subunit 6 [Orbilia oligospora]|nr:ubiquinol--cytochrome-c reductase subunit 6 [Orbilia oligospora]KAF3245745.1 ubiquinol--cytochrome-c reductase subunit 6 [Orbilia oligospora]KAF3249231.1 ubiquinol--cytochrome-c reductase subunit 6 [Orbilia oligospora]KAF3288913.1 ubiquinol--cytochrome-c reductase subunit 6 [Orbilia oligospora]
MTLSQFLSDIYESFTVAEAKAEAPPAEEKEEASEEKEEEKEEATAEEEEEEEEPEDILPQLQEECQNSKKCAPYKHHYDECAERVQKWDDAEEGEREGKRESCVEEYFHLMHCTGDCVAPKLWAKLK